MKYCLKFLLLFTALQCIINLTPVKAQQHINAAIPGDFADPSIIKAGNKYYAVGTSSEWAPHFPIYTSTDLKSWKLSSYVFDKTPEWISGSFWAPEYYYHNNTYFIYYTARRKKDGVSCVGVATSKYPDRGFVDRGVIIDHGKEAIDGFVYNDNGQLYISFKAYGLDNRPIELLGSKLSADGLKLEGEIFPMLKDVEKIGMEGQSILKKDGYYYVFYSAGNCCGGGCSYNVRVARAQKIQGPYEYYSGNPILTGNEDWKCTGHGTFVTGPDGNQYYLHHAYSKQSPVITGRQGLIAQLTWPTKGGWPVFKYQQPSAVKPDNNITEAFKGNIPAKYWMWDFRNSTPAIKQNNGKLTLSGTAKAGNQTGIVLTVRPVAAAFDVSATVINHNNALKGVAFYGDANAALGIGAIGNKVQYWVVKDNKRVILAEANIAATSPVEVKLSLSEDMKCTVYYKQAKSGWKELTAANAQSADFLPQWDRSPRPGLHFKGTATGSAQFSSFRLVNR